MGKITLADKLKNLYHSGESTTPMSPSNMKPAWGGPSGEGPNCGITYTLLSRFLGDRERFRIMVVEGLKPIESFNHRIHYGSMWHVCEQYYSQGQSWEQALVLYARDLCLQYRDQQSQIDHWYRVCRSQFPIYIEYWKENCQGIRKVRVLEEQVFNVAYTLPSGRTVNLRGKWDGVDIIPSPVGDQGPDEIWLFETKTKGDLRPGQIQRQLTFDLQTMLYIVALQEYYKLIGQFQKKFYSVRGICYNAIRRPLSGGKGTIVRHKGRNGKGEETKDHFYERVAGYIKNNPSWYFMRWDVNLSSHDVEKFKIECLNPVLEQLCDWWQWIKYMDGDPFLTRIPKDLGSEDMRAGVLYGPHWRHPYGVYNPLDEGGSTAYDNYLESGSEEGLVRTNSLFPELEVTETT